MSRLGVIPKGPPKGGAIQEHTQRDKGLGFRV